MDFSKLNNEFANMQIIITKYNNITNEINIRIKNNKREINRLENKIENTKNILEKDLYKVLIDTIKNETTFIENLIAINNKNEEKGK